MVNSSLGAMSTMLLSFEIISSDTFSFKLSSNSKFISSVFNVFWFVWASVFVKFLSENLFPISFSGEEPLLEFVLLRDFSV
jgi:hypothetical protein